MSKTPEVPSRAALEGVRAHAQKILHKEYDLHIDLPTGTSYNRAIQQTLIDLQHQIQNEKVRTAELEREISKAPIWDSLADEPREHLRQLQALSTGFNALAKSEPRLPVSTSELPTLLATQDTFRIAKETKQQISHLLSSLQSAREDLQAEEANFSEATLLEKALRLRVESLRLQTTSNRARESVPAYRTSSELLAAEAEQSKAYEQDQRRLTGLLGGFIQDKLALVLAAEELGGPVAGSALDITEEMLAAGFDSRGKPNRGRSKTTDDRRQQRIDEMFGGLGEDADSETLRTEASLASQATKELLGDLLETAVDHGSRRYVETEKEVAISRFLVRAKVVVLDPKDARKMRLVDFGKPLEESE